MATRPTPRSRDGTRPRSTSGGPPSSPRSSDASRQPARAPLSASPASDKPMPSFLRPTVSSSMHKAPVVQPVGAPRPITPKVDKAKAKASTSRWSTVSPRQLMQKASNALKATKSRGTKSNEVAGPAASASGGKEVASASAETARAQPIEEQHRPPETTAEAPPDVQAEEAVEPKAAQDDQQEATPQEVVSTNIKTEEEMGQEEQVSADETRGDAEKEEAVSEDKVVLEESEAVKVPETGEKPQTDAVEETENEGQQNAEDELPPAPAAVEAAAKELATPTAVLEAADEESATPTAVVEAAAKELATPTAVVEAAEKESATPTAIVEATEESAMPTGQDEPAASTVEETVVKETKADERQHEGLPKPEELTENSETSVTSEEPAEQPAATEKQVEVAGASEMAAASRALSEPATSLEEALEEVETPTKAALVSSSEPVTPAKEAINMEKAVIETVLSASAPTTPVKDTAKKKEGSTSMARIPEEAGLMFKGSKVNTAMKRSDEAQPKKKEVARSNDMIEEAKSKLLEKRKSKVKALVGAFETVMDSPGRSSPGRTSFPS